MRYIVLLLSILLLFNCDRTPQVPKISLETPFVWEGATIYFLMTDRFNNGDTLNDINFHRTKETGKLRGFMGGDLKGVTQKIKDGYFTNLGISALWLTPVVEQIHGGTDEGTGFTYGYHGYWAKDWTVVDPNFGTKDDLREMVNAAHQKGIRVLLDAVINHTGPVTEQDTLWPEAWVRTQPKCDFKSFETTVECTLVDNLPDIRTERSTAVDLPPQLVEKWKLEGRYDQEISELDAFFNRTGYPRAPRFYIMKWLADYILEFGIDGYRVDTVKHIEPYVWQEFRKVCDDAFAQYKTQNPAQVLDDVSFYLVGEVYNYGITSKRTFDFGDRKVDYFDHAFNALINFEAKWNAAQMPEELFFKRYSDVLHSDLKGYSVLNYFSSHDDGQPFDSKREKPFETATKLLLCPGASQVYYGDELGRSLDIEGTQGDATLRSFMNWDALKGNKVLLEHWQRLGKFRRNHPAVGAGVHQMIVSDPYIFSRTFEKGDYNDKVIIALNMAKGKKEIVVSSVFLDSQNLKDAYSGAEAKVVEGKVVINSPYNLVLLEALK